MPPQPNHILVTHADSTTVCGKDLEKQGEEILLREQSGKRGNSPQLQNGTQQGRSQFSWSVKVRDLCFQTCKVLLMQLHNKVESIPLVVFLVGLPGKADRLSLPHGGMWTPRTLCSMGTKSVWPVKN